MDFSRPIGFSGSTAKVHRFSILCLVTSTPTWNKLVKQVIGIKNWQESDPGRLSHDVSELITRPSPQPQPYNIPNYMSYIGFILSGMFLTSLIQTQGCRKGTLRL